MKQFFNGILQTFTMLLIVSTVWISGLSLGPEILQNFTDYFIWFYTVLITLVMSIRFTQYVKGKLFIRQEEMKSNILIKKINSFVPFLFPLSGILLEYYILGTISVIAILMIRIICSAKYIESLEIEKHLRGEYEG